MAAQLRDHRLGSGRGLAGGINPVGGAVLILVAGNTVAAEQQPPPAGVKQLLSPPPTGYEQYQHSGYEKAPHLASVPCKHSKMQVSDARTPLPAALVRRGNGRLLCSEDELWLQIGI
jgi:hypothetical protein